MGSPREEYWSGLPCPSPGYLPNPGIELKSPAWQMDSFPLNHLGKMNFKIASERIKCLGINLTKEGKDLYTENHKIMMKEIEEI